MVRRINTIEVKPCQHCGHAKAGRPRGLCWTCFYLPGVRERYAVSDSPYARRGLANGNRNAPLPESPTDALPGSEAKIAILAERARRREALFHPQDLVPE